MTTEEERCAEARRFQRAHDAFVRGDMAEARLALDDPDGFPNASSRLVYGMPLVYAVFYSPLAFIRELLEAGANPDGPADDGFPPIMAALSMLQDAPGATRRDDIDDVVTLLLEHGADPNQRGLNDFTPLHYLAGLGDVGRIRLMLAHGADPALKTRIDDYETPKQVALTAGHTAAAALL